MDANDTDDAPSSWSNPHMEKINRLDAEIDAHPGTQVGNRIENLRRIGDAWAGFSDALGDLLRMCETAPPFVIALASNIGDMSNQRQIERWLDQSLIAYVASLVALRDHTGILVKKHSGPEVQALAKEQALTLSAEYPSSNFLMKLRNYILHNVVAPWDISGTFSSPPTCRVALNTATLLEDEHWNQRERDFLRENGESVHLLPLLAPYRGAVITYVETVVNAVIRENQEHLVARDELAKRVNLLLSGGVTDGEDWEERVAHMSENIRRADRGEPTTDYRTGLPFPLENPSNPKE